jgi:hypothetical protein
MRSFIVKMRLTDIREYFVEAKNAEEAAAKRRERGSVHARFRALPHGDWEVCEVKPVSGGDATKPTP